MVMALRVTVGAFFLCWSFFAAHSKVYDRCELAREFRDIYKFPEEELGTWLCIAYYESLFNTSALNPGSGDHGLFQISEQFWCAPSDVPETVLPCAMPCSVFEDDDIKDDVNCAQTVYKHHKKVSGDGFTGWVVYNSHCKNPVRVAAFLDGCFGNGNLTSASTPTSAAPSSSTAPAAALSTSFRFPKLLSGRTVFYKSTSALPPFSAGVKPTSPRPPIKVFKYKPLRPYVSSPEPLKPQIKFSPKYRPVTKVPAISSLSNDFSTVYSSGVHRFSPSTTFSSSFKPFSSTSAPRDSRFFGGNNAFSTASKSAENKYNAKRLEVESHENAYAIVNNEGHSFAIGPSGFKLVWTGQ